MRRWEISNQVNGQLLKQVGAGGGERRECGDSWVDIDLYLLAKSAARDEVVNKGGHTQPPIVTRQQGVGAKEPPVAGSKG